MNNEKAVVLAHVLSTPAGSTCVMGHIIWHNPAFYRYVNLFRVHTQYPLVVELTCHMEGLPGLEDNEGIESPSDHCWCFFVIFCHINNKKAVLLAHVLSMQAGSTCVRGHGIWHYPAFYRYVNPFSVHTQYFLVELTQHMDGPLGLHDKEGMES